MGVFELSYYILVVALLILAAMFLLLPLPKNKNIANYSLSLKVLAASYVVLSGYCVYKMSYPIDIFSFPFLLAAASQAHLLGISHINMLNTNAVSKRYLLRMIFPTFLLALACIFCVVVGGYHHLPDYSTLWSCLIVTVAPDVIVRIICFAYYVGLSAYYIYSYYKEELKIRHRLGDFTSDEAAGIKGLRYIHFSFLLVLLVVVDTVFITTCVNKQTCAIYNMAILLLYVGIGLLYIQYPKSFLSLQYVVAETTEAESTSETSRAEAWSKWKSVIEGERLYVQPGITVVWLAQYLGTNRTTLSLSINQNEGVNFNTFINNLRIEEAQRYLRENPDSSMADVCLKVGYTDQANFSRHFKQIVGMSPLEWKRANCLAFV
ncbi:MAG: helix-turn-helix domain-containing protein [Paludibacteraceae bacterium]|nr:helix-turn-helix domain-containing protein [Paludibacteraceae bacterium]